MFDSALLPHAIGGAGSRHQANHDCEVRDIVDTKDVDSEVCQRPVLVPERTLGNPTELVGEFKARL